MYLKRGDAGLAREEMVQRVLPYVMENGNMALRAKAMLLVAKTWISEDRAKAARLLI